MARRIHKFAPLDMRSESEGSTGPWTPPIGDFHMYHGKPPIIVTGMKPLEEHGPAGAVFRRFGRPHNQTLLDGIGNPRREAHDTRKQAE